VSYRTLFDLSASRLPMKSSSIVFVMPFVVLLLLAAGMFFWLTAGKGLDLALRVPGRDREGVVIKEDERPLVGTFAAGPGQPANLPGAWPRFRGERFDGIVHETVSLARSWPSGSPAELWALELGEGHAGAAVRDGRVYVLDYDQEKEADVLRCLSLADGREIWNYSYPVQIKRYHGMSRTIPAVSDKYVVTLGPKCQIMCLDARSGECFWLKDMVKEFGATVPDWYAGQCPLIDGERAIFAPGGDSLLMALDCRTGDVVWESPNPRGWTMTHASIMPMEFAGKKTYVYFGKGGVAGVSAEDGSLLWDTTAWKIGIATCPSPVILPDGKIFCSGGYNSGAVMLQLKEEGGKIRAEELFRLKPKQFGSTQQTPIFHENHLFGVREHDKQFVCLDLDGNEVWSSGRKNRFGKGGPYLLADGLFYILDESGVLTMAEATTEGFRPLAQATVLKGHDAWAPMALVAGRLLLRDLTRMVCLDVAESLPQPGPSGEQGEGP
jgi:outer membrane protein assembly factor BamB